MSSDCDLEWVLTLLAHLQRAINMIEGFHP